jgi:hypothetical protein
MSAYKNFVSDFPARCAAILESYEGRARLRKHDLTLMLCVAMPGIVIPLERLAAPRLEPPRRGHPLKDWERFDEAKCALERLYEQPFLGSCLWPNAAPESWCGDDLGNVSSSPDCWSELRKPKPLGKDKRIRSVLGHIRNSLAHGNILTTGDSEIQQVIFVSERAKDSGKFKFLLATPADFRRLLMHWLQFVSDLEIPDDVVAERPDDAASYV